jgi:hypothetical protein
MFSRIFKKVSLRVFLLKDYSFFQNFLFQLELHRVVDDLFNGIALLRKNVGKLNAE